MSRFFLRLRAVVLGLSLLPPAAPSAPPPVEHFFREFEFKEMTLSPDGRHIAMTGPSRGRANLAVFDLDQREPRWLTGFGDRDVYGVRWVGGRLVFQAAVHGFDSGALYAIDRDSTDARILVSSLRKQAEGVVTSFRLVDPFSNIPGSDEHLLVEKESIDQFNTARDLGTPDILRFNIRTGGSEVEARNPGDVVAWVADLQGRVRAALAVKRATTRLLYRDTPADAWREVKSWEFGQPGVYPVTFAGDNRRLLVNVENPDRPDSLALFDPATGAVGRNLWQHDVVDPGGLLLDPHTLAAVGVAWDAGRPEQRFFDQQLQAAQAAVDRALPDTFNALVDYSRDRKRLLYLAASDRDPGTYVLLDTEKRAVEVMGSRAGWIKPADMAPMRAIQYRSRDGLTIHGYLTAPADGRSGPWPLVVMPHGGPWSRDHWGFDPDVQFLASRGYAVLQPNFRGSTGYGLAFTTAGFKQWGRKMQDDITDGVQWAVQEGIADPRRVAIFGASYGGYAVLAGLVQTPELYRCGINYVGVTDLVMMLRGVASRMPARFAAGHKLAVGDLRADREQLEASSPVNQVEKIRAPLLMAYGELDPVVHIDQGRKLARVLRRAGKEFELITEPMEGHGFRIEKNRIELYRKIEAFLAKHLE